MPAATQSASRSPRAGRVLVVDDNADLAGALCDVLSGASAYDLAVASCGADALAIASKERFDVAIVDVKLPDASGVDLIVPLREAMGEGEVVLITGFATMDAALAALRSGAFALILKSFRPEELVATVEQAITKVRLSRERAELERRYRAVVELTDVLVVALDEDGRVLLFNRKAAAMARVDPDGARGRDFALHWIPEAERPKVKDALAAALVSDRAREVEAGFGPAPTNGAPQRVRWHLSRARGPIAEAEGAIVYGIGIDTTERRALEKRAADAEALSAMGTLAMGLAHEVRNPLNAANLQLHLLGRGIDRLAAIDDGVRGSLLSRVRVVGDEIGRLGRLLTEFLELARPRDIARHAVNLAALVDDVFALERGAAEERGIRLQREACEETVLALGDSEKLKQVVINLVVNALEAMKEGGSLTARVGSDAARCSLRLEDTGPGIEPAVLAQVFDPFFTTKEAGTGLGLSIVRKIVDQHGGEVSIESTRGVGACVTIVLPSARRASDA